MVGGGGLAEKYVQEKTQATENKNINSEDVYKNGHTQPISKFLSRLPKLTYVIRIKNQHIFCTIPFVSLVHYTG